MIAVGEETHYIGDVLAGIVAESEKIAREALELIDIQYEVLTPLSDPEFALLPDAPIVYPKGNKLSECHIKRGDIEKAISESAYISSGTYYLSLIHI